MYDKNTTQMVTISKRAQKELKNNQRAIAKLVLLFDVHAKTIERWIESKDVRLTNPSALEIIKEETKMSDAHLLTA